MFEKRKLLTIKTNDHNPDSRTGKHAIDELKTAILENIANGRDPLPETERLLIGCDGVLGDGHRRLAALLSCGVDEFYCETDAIRTADEIFMHKGEARPHTSKQCAEALVGGVDVRYLPKNQRAEYARLVKLCGPDAPIFVAKKGMALTCRKELSRLIEYLDIEFDQEFNFRALKWMINNRLQKHLRLYLDEKRKTPQELIQLINSNRDLFA